MSDYSYEHTAQLRDRLTGALIGLARATDGNAHLISASSDAIVIEALTATLANSEADDSTLQKLLGRVEEEKRKMVPNCFSCASPCGRNNDYDIKQLWEVDEDIRSLKFLILLGICGMAACAYRASVLGRHDDAVDRFFYKALIVIGMDGCGTEALLPIVLEMGQVNLKCMALLENTN